MEGFLQLAGPHMQRRILGSRLDAINDAQRRATVALFLCTLASGTIMAGLWNAYLSWDRQWAQLAKKPEGWGQEQLMLEQIREWMQSNTVGVSLLGIRLSVSDAAVLGSLILLIFSFYYCLCMRRQNHEVGSLLEAIKDETKDTKEFVFCRIRSWMILTTATSNDAPYTKLYSPPSSQQSIPFSRSGLKLLSYLPAIAVLLILLSDIYFSFLFVSPWRENQGPAWNRLSYAYRTQLVLTDTFAFLAGLLVLRFGRYAEAFSAGTMRMTEDLGQQLRATGPRSLATQVGD
jgi:hypothetical protein